MQKILVDTNLLLDDPDILFKLKDEYDVIVLSVVVLKELDRHKFNRDLAYSARAAIRSIKEFKDNYIDKLEFIVNDEDISSNDELIIAAAKKTGAIIATKDVSMSIISESKDVEVKLYGNIANGIYDPYVYTTTLSLSEEEFTYQQVYDGEEYNKAIIQLLPYGKSVNLDSWFFVIINESTTSPMIYAHNPLTIRLERIDNLPKYRSISKGKMDVKAKDIYQVCAIYALYNADHVLLTGSWGSGKSLLSSAYAIANNQKKSFISRPPLGVDKIYDIGYLPGPKYDKLEAYAMGFLSALYFLYGNTRLQEKEGKTFDYVKEEVFKKVFELIDANSLQGLSLLDDILVVDEVQYCTIDLVSMILSRATKESKIILTGDLAQSYSMKPSNSGLLKLLRAMPHESMAYVDLKYNYRAKLSELADKLQDKSF